MSLAPPLEFGIKVVVVDDSAFMRKVVRDCLTAAGFDVVGFARDGLEALEKIAELKPDVVILDLVMPNLDGVGVLKGLAGKPGPRVVVLSLNDADSMLGVAALQEGAFCVVHKPSTLATPQLFEVGEKLVEMVKAAGAAQTRQAPLPFARVPLLTQLCTTREVLVIGASAGGPQALTTLISSLPANFPLPVALVLHLPAPYTAALVKRLDEASALNVIEAAEGLELKMGRVIVAQAGRHLKLSRAGGRLVCRLDVHPLETQHRPAVDVLFQSAAALVGSVTLAVVLTGMGDDGLVGAKAIHAAGGTVLTEAEQSCVVYGMPRVVKEAGLSAAEAPIERMVEEIIRFL